MQIPADSPSFQTTGTPPAAAGLFPRPYTLFDGILIGQHNGVEHFHLGQRKKLTGGGFTQPLYVIGKEYKHNRLFVGAGNNHPGLQAAVFRYAALGSENVQVSGFSGKEIKGQWVSADQNLPALLKITTGETLIIFEQPQSITLYETNASFRLPDGTIFLLQTLQ